MRVLKESFNAGEFTPKLRSRYELSKYKNGCKTLTNFVPLPHGPVARRPGTEFIASAKTNTLVRLIPFIFSEEDAYILEFGNLYIRFFRNGGQVQTVDTDTKLLLHCDGENNSTTITDDGDTGHTASITGSAHLEQYRKKFGSAGLVGPGDGHYISFADHADWTFGSGNFTVDFWVLMSGSVLGENGLQGFFSQIEDSDNNYKMGFDPDTSTLYFIVETSGVDEVTLSASWTPVIHTWYHLAVVRGWNGNANEWAICVNGAALDTDTVNYTIPNYAGAFRIMSIGTNAEMKGVIDEFSVKKGVARWTTTFAPPTSQYPFGDDSGTVYEVETTYVKADIENLHYVQSADTMYIVHENYPVRKLVRTDHADWAISNVTFTDAPAAWSANDYPRTVEFYEDRLCFGGSPDQPDTVWTSEVGAYTTFTVGAAAAADPITLTLSARQVNSIKWLSAARRLLAGTGGEEWWIAGPSDNEPVTPSDHVARRDSAIGSSRIMPVNIGDKIFFAQRGNRIIREVSYDFGSDKYVSVDLSILAEHLTKEFRIVSMAYQQHPYQILWCVREDGKIISLTYMKEHDVVGWAFHEYDTANYSAFFESVAVIPGQSEDEVWFEVYNWIDSSNSRSLVRLKPFGFGTIEDAFYVDLGLSYDGVATTTISGLDHLEGEAVAVLADGVSVTGKTVSSGSITLSTAASKIHVGIANTPVLETLDAVVGDDQGPLAGQIKRITNVSLNLVESMGGQYGSDASHLEDIPYDGSALFTGWTRDLSFDEGFDVSSNIYITTSDPLPLEIGAISIDIEE